MSAVQFQAFNSLRKVGFYGIFHLEDPLSSSYLRYYDLRQRTNVTCNKAHQEKLQIYHIMPPKKSAAVSTAAKSSKQAQRHEVTDDQLQDALEELHAQLERAVKSVSQGQVRHVTKILLVCRS